MAPNKTNKYNLKFKSHDGNIIDKEVNSQLMEMRFFKETFSSIQASINIGTLKILEIFVNQEKLYVWNYHITPEYNSPVKRIRIKDEKEFTNWKDNNIIPKSRESKIHRKDNEVIMETAAKKSKDYPYKDFFGNVGIFWYDDDLKRLFGIYKTPVAELQSEIGTTSMLHNTYWNRNRVRLQKITEKFEITDYTQIPRGRVFFHKKYNNHENIFLIFTGTWINDYPEAKNLILEEFELSDENHKFIIDKHWDIGHGYSGDFDFR